jgi:hypothetical protein
MASFFFADSEAANLVRTRPHVRSSRIVLVFLSLQLLATVLPSPSSSPPSQTPARDSAVRPCGPGNDEPATPSRPGKRNKKGASPAQPDDVTTCLEVRASALEVQERLQQFVRAQRWAITDEDVTETLWNFSFPLDKEDLVSYAKPPVGTDRINWQRGKVVVLVRSVSVTGGYARTTVSAQFRGFGESDDTFATQRSFWTWISNGKLEARFASELRTRFGAIP